MLTLWPVLPHMVFFHNRYPLHLLQSLNVPKPVAYPWLYHFYNRIFRVYFSAVSLERWSKYKVCCLVATSVHAKLEYIYIYIFNSIVLIDIYIQQMLQNSDDQQFQSRKLTVFSQYIWYILLYWCKRSIDLVQSNLLWIILYSFLIEQCFLGCNKA